ncbi:RNA-directed DNA polymerase from mobile element jockey [Trichonephila clavipes]|nr:RNA-directed DNA polymerase from mobile element jockey [Trichonephila clavipes]
MDNAILIPSLNATASRVTNATKPVVRGSIGKYATRTVNFLQLNIIGTQKKCAELSDILNENNIHVACLQETRLNSKLHFNVKRYTTIRKDRVSGAGGGIAFLEPTTHEKQSWNFRKANWDGFTQELENLCSDLPKHNDAEKLLRLFSSCIQKAAKHHIPRGKRRNNWIPFWKDPNIKDLIQERDSIGQELQRNNSEELKRNFIEVSHRVEELILESKKEKWAELCSKLDPRKETSQYWNLLKNRRSKKEAANMLAKQYEVTSRLNFTEDRLQYKKFKSIIKHNKNNCAEDVFTSDFTLEELEYAIRRLNPKKSPGPDVIYGQMIVHFGEIAKKYLLNIFITSWRSGKLPKIWKSSVIIPILKPGKDATSCKSYRPISLTCILCKLMERIIHSRLIKFLMEHNFLHFYQTAYRANHSTVDQPFYLSQTIINGFQEKPHEKTVAVFLDLSLAFN